MAIYTGALQPKKKSELQELAAELGLDNTGTKDDIQERIKTHLADNQLLAQDERFAGLYGRRKKTFNRESSQQPEASPVPEEEHTGGVMTRRSMANKIFASPAKEKISEPPAVVSAVSNAVSHPPSSPVRSMIAAFNKAVAAAPEAEAVKEVIETKRRQLYAEGNKAMDGARTYLSNAKNISSLTILAELLFIIYTFVPWAYYAVPLNAPYKVHADALTPIVEGQPLVSTRIAHVPYPPAWFLKSSFAYTTLLNWALPTILLPQLVATLISFRPNIDWSRSQESDALTAAIIRVACVLAGEWGLNWSAVGVTGKWRLLGASVAAAFAFAEAIGERKNPGSSSTITAEPEDSEESQAIVPHKSSRL